jgi:Zn finger protein HypA/HybF involved in hydrogenase expression
LPKEKLEYYCPTCGMIAEEIEGATAAELAANLKNAFSQEDEFVKICSKCGSKAVRLRRDAEKKE